jgi:hypothetical protein
VLAVSTATVSSFLNVAGGLDGLGGGVAEAAAHDLIRERDPVCPAAEVGRPVTWKGGTAASCALIKAAGRCGWLRGQARAPTGTAAVAAAGLPASRRPRR